MFKESPQTEAPKSFYPNIGQSFLLLIRLTLISIPLSIPYIVVMILNRDYGLPYGQLLASLSLLLAYGLSFFIVARLGMKRIRKFDKPEYRLKFNMEPYQVLLVVGLMAIAASTLISAVTDLLPESDWFNDYMSQLAQPNVFAFLTMVVAAPVLEEILFRGVILEGLLKNYSPAKAIIWSAVIFGVAHMNMWQTTSAILAGLLLGWIYWKSKSIIPGMVIHFVNNLVGYIAMINAANANESLSDGIGDKLIYGTVLLIALGLFILTWRWLNKRWTRPTPEPAL
ncbi:CPBP family intramembrane glutamic endopeptidase [Prolixibacter sp. NT017]|uniref:CPBP family intramembrane glutamic endopeptidase n=1 Tax=Prolixibacter sp. NT017 TaxID=2652390 RepID=UPI00129908CC|nr:type II CAAX endopeptidase family protein [Prolixibacter sp. NT017]